MPYRPGSVVCRVIPCGEDSGDVTSERAVSEWWPEVSLPPGRISDHEVWRGHTLLGCRVEIGNIDTLSVTFAYSLW